MKKRRQSFSALKMYSECGKKYDLHYNKRFRNKNFHSALGFGSAIDIGLNKLLLTKDVVKSKQEFDKTWSFQTVNDNYVSLPEHKDLVYAETDLDTDLLFQDDFDKLETWLQSNNQLPNWEQYLQIVFNDKKTFGYDNLDDTKRTFYNYINWLCLKNKGHIMIDSYNAKVMPKITNVVAVQHETVMKSNDGDEVIQYLDLIADWEDGRRVLFDNKTSAKEYEEDSAGTSQQLISYYYQSKEEFKLDAVGFIVLRKSIIKNKEKKCSSCGHNGTGSRAQTCNNELSNGFEWKKLQFKLKSKRCDGVWIEKIRPEAAIQFIINDVSESAQELVLNTFGEAIHGINKEHWYSNLSACKQGSIKCNFYDYCWKNDKKNIIQVKEKVKK